MENTSTSLSTRERSVGITRFAVILLIVSICAAMTGSYLCIGSISGYHSPSIKTDDLLIKIIVEAFKPRVKDIVYSFPLLRLLRHLRLLAMTRNELCTPLIYLSMGILKLSNIIRIQYLIIATAFLAFVIYSTFIFTSFIFFFIWLPMIPFYLMIITNIIGLIYLTRNKVKEQFK